MGILDLLAVLSRCLLHSRIRFPETLGDVCAGCHLGLIGNADRIGTQVSDDTDRTTALDVYALI